MEEKERNEKRKRRRRRRMRRMDFNMEDEMKVGRCDYKNCKAPGVDMHIRLKWIVKIVVVVFLLSLFF